MPTLNKFIRTDGPVRLVGRWTWLTSIYGFAGIFINFVILLIGTPYGYEVVKHPCQDPCQISGQLTAANFADLQKIGISPDTYATFYVTVLWIFAIITFGAASLLLWKKPGELLPFCAAMIIMGLPSVEGEIVFFSGVFQDYPYLGTIFNYLDIPGEIITAYLFLTFPNGKFKSRIFWLLFIAIGVADTLVSLYLAVFNIVPAGDSTTLIMPVAFPLTLVALMAFYIQERNFSWRNTGKYLLWAVLCSLAILVTVYFIDFAVFLVVLIYRSLKVLTPRERVPTKWLIYGFTFFLIMIISFYIIFPLFPVLYAPGNYFFIILNLIGFFGCGINMTGMLMAVLYANAFDINLVIKRTIIYSSLTFLIIGIYVGSVIGLQELVRAITGQQSDLAIAGATLVSFVLFQPLRKAIQGFVDRRFYRRKYNAIQTIAGLNDRLKTEMDLQTLSQSLRGVLDETLQPQQLTVWFKKKV